MNINEEIYVPRIDEKFFVIKAETVVKNLTHEEFEQFVNLMEKAGKGVEDHRYLVVNVDEPYADKIEQMILEGEREKIENGRI